VLENLADKEGSGQGDQRGDLSRLQKKHRINGGQRGGTALWRNEKSQFVCEKKGEIEKGLWTKTDELAVQPCFQKKDA